MTISPSTSHSVPSHKAGPASGKASENTFPLLLAVAPKATVRARYDDALYAAAEKNLVGKTPLCLSPQEAKEALATFQAKHGTPPSAICLAGPGDPFATPGLTLETLRLLREICPGTTVDIITCGLNTAAHAEALAQLGNSQVTIILHAVDPAITEQLYGWIRPGTKTLPLTAGAALLVEHQITAITALRRAGIPVRIHTTVYPGINDSHIVDLAARAASLGVKAMRLAPYTPFADTTDSTGTTLPVADGTQPQALPKPDDALMQRLYTEAKRFLPVEPLLESSFGAIGYTETGANCGEYCAEAITPQAGFPIPEGDRPYVAVASSNGFDVDEHLGHARKFLVYGPKNGPVSLLEARTAPNPGGGDSRWEALAGTLNDCRYVLAAGAGERPREVLAAHGIRVIQTEENIEGSVDVLYGGGKRGKGRAGSPAGNRSTGA